MALAVASRRSTGLRALGSVSKKPLKPQAWAPVQLKNQAQTILGPSIVLEFNLNKEWLEIEMGAAPRSCSEA
jgi:hypothetical protein